MIDVWPSVVSAFLVAAGLFLLCRSGLAMRLAQDVPNARSLHTKITPRVGGFVMTPIVVAMITVTHASVWQPALMGLSLFALSAWDDRYGVSSGLRFAVHSVIAFAVVAWLDFPLSLAVLVLLVFGVVWMTNLFNFMDGADGLAGGMALFGFGVMAVIALGRAPTVAEVSLLLAAGALGFLVMNFPPARVFMGDAGSIPLGFFAAFVSLWGWRESVWSPWLPLLVFSPFVLDASVTLLRRAARREKLWQAHREHYYQRLVRMGWSHRRLVAAEYLLMAAAGLTAYVINAAGDRTVFVGLAAWGLVYLALALSIDRRWQRFIEVQQ